MNKKFVAGVALVSAMGALTACSSQQLYDMCGRMAVQQAEESKTQERFINVSASSEVKVAPDRANVYLGAEVSRGTAPLAENDVRKRANKLIEVLKDFGIDEACIKTTDYSLYPRYEYIDDSRNLTGYQASMTVEVSGIDIELISDVISKATEAGVNTVNGIEYTCSEYDELYADALADAISIAELKAQRMADAAHVELGYAVSINEGYQDTVQRYTVPSYNAKSMAYDEVADAGSAVAPGEITIEASVSVAYSLGDVLEGYAGVECGPDSEVECTPTGGVECDPGQEVKVRVDDTGKEVEVYLEPVEGESKNEIPAVSDEDMQKDEEPVAVETEDEAEIRRNSSSVRDADNFDMWENEQEDAVEDEEQAVEDGKQTVEDEEQVYRDIEVNVVGPDDVNEAEEVEETTASEKLGSGKNRNRAINHFSNDRVDLDESN